ncbi:MAG: hypothetical protein HOY69_24250, partial [Streptomyces sp.]|nr:hypothetical protein [Streptomyces sp.]
SDVGVTDDLVARVTCESTALAPGQSTTCRGSYTITRAAVHKCLTSAKPSGGTSDGCVRCPVTNTALAHGTGPNGDRVTSLPARATITVTVHDGHPGKRPPHYGAHR